MQIIKYKKLYPGAVAPSRKHPTDAGMDLCALNRVILKPMQPHIPAPEPQTFEQGETFITLADPVNVDIVTVRTGLAFEIPVGTMMRLLPKSRSNYLILGGVVDAGYQGEILVKIANISAQELVFEPGTPIVQAVVMPIFTPTPVEDDTIHTQATERGGTGGIVSQTDLVR